MYILLEDGMKMLSSDEAYCYEDSEWSKISNIAIGTSFISDFYVPVRRKINTIEELVTAYNTPQDKTPKDGASSVR